MIRLARVCCGLAALLCCGPTPAAAPAAPVEVRSPDGKIVAQLEAVNAGGIAGRLVYRVNFQGQPVLLDSGLGFDLKDAPPLDRGFRIVGQQPATHDATWKPLYGERAVVRDCYREVVVHVEDNQSPPRRMDITLRAYDAGIAFCYAFPQQPGLDRFTIAAENTEFHFTGDHTGWAVYSAQGVYKPTPLSQIKRECERPLTVEIPGGPWVAVGEARLVDFARMRFRPVAGAQHTLAALLGSPAQVAAPYTTPWRFVMIADTPGGLIEKNDLLLNLNAPCAIQDTSWIKPGKVIRETTLTTEGGKACIDFAVRRGLQYIEYDAGWYGHEYDKTSDATKVNVDKKKTGFHSGLDLAEVVAHGQTKGIGVLLYVNRVALEKQLDEVLPLYEKWGIKGVKYGFVQVGPQQWTDWLHLAIRKAAQHHLMVDVHDEYRPTGYSRTYPNLMTVEGIGGNETMPDAVHNATLPFTRFVCGPADYTICWYSDRVKNSCAHQLALAVVYYSPWQFLYWYDRPAMDKGEPELDFFKQVPTVWDDTRVVQGKIGQYATVARRSGRDWFVGTINAVERRQLKIPLTFLEPGKRYTAEIYSDKAPDGSDRRGVTCTKRDVDATTVLEADLAANGGQAIRLVAP